MTRNYTLEFNDLIKNTLAKELKKIGFKKSNFSFMRPLDELTQTCNVQRSMYNHADSTRFTMNFGIYIPRIYEILHKTEKINKFPKPHDCHIEGRTGALIYGEDYWYELNEEVSAETLTKQFLGDIQNHLTPMFEYLRTIDAVLELIRTDYKGRKYPIGVNIDANAIIEMEFGDPKRGGSILRGQYEDALTPKLVESKRIYPDGQEEILYSEYRVNQHRVERVKQLAQRYGIEL